MFSIHLKIVAQQLEGLRALDQFRRLRLPDGVHFCTDGLLNTYRTYPVGEGFARAHFGPDSTNESVVVPLHLLTPEDVDEYIPNGGDRRYLCLRKDMPPERAQELFRETRRLHAAKEGKS